MTTLTQTWNQSENDAARWSRGKAAFAWTLQILSAAMFLFAGTHKLAGGEDMVQAFATIGIGQWFRYFTALLEIAGAITLLRPVAGVLWRRDSHRDDDRRGDHPPVHHRRQPGAGRGAADRQRHYRVDARAPIMSAFSTLVAIAFSRQPRLRRSRRLFQRIRGSN